MVKERGCFGEGEWERASERAGGLCELAWARERGSYADGVWDRVEGVRGSEGATHERLSGRADILEKDAVTVSFSGAREEERGIESEGARGAMQRENGSERALTTRR